MNTVIKSFLLPLICAVGILAAPTPFSVVHAANPLPPVVDTATRAQIKWATGQFCGRQSGLVYAYQAWWGKHTVDYNAKTITEKEYEKKKFDMNQTIVDGLGFSITDIISACALIWAY